MNRTKNLLVWLFCIVLAYQVNAQTAQTLPFTQDWSNTALITTNNVWTGVPGIIGYRGDDITAATGVDPQTLLGEGTIVVNVTANQTNPNTNTAGGVAEFESTYNVVALQGSGTADAPNIVISLNTKCMAGIQVNYNLKDIDGSTDNAIQAVALQYRIGNTGPFTNVPAGFVADATSGPSLATLVTAVSATLPAACDNQALVQVRIITSNAAGNDEWVGIDDINITGTATGPTAAVISGSGSFCSETNTGDIPMIVTITGGTAPDSVVITDGVTNYTYNSYTSGSPIALPVNVTTTFTLVSVKDANGCAVAPANLSGAAVVTIISCGPCDLSSTGLADVHCENNEETSSSADDYIWFTLNPTGTNLGNQGYNVSVSSGSVLLNGSSPANNVPYGSASFFRLQSGSAGAGNITLTVTDSQTGSACMITDVVVDPGACSQQEPAVTVTITDPCSCNNDASLAGNDGTFGEEITVTGPAGANVTAVCNGCVGYTGFTEVTPGVYVASFNHVDNLGYLAIISINGVFQDSISNICAYPDVFIDAQGPFVNCAGQASVLLTADISGDGGMGTYNWSGSGVMGSNFNASGLPAGTNVITLNYQGEANGNVSLDGITPAYPGCIQIDTAHFIITNGLPVNEGQGGSVCANASFTLGATGTGTWSGGAGSFNNPNLPNASYTPAPSEAGTTVILTWTVQGACAPNFDTVWINVIALPTVNAGSDISACFGPVTLAAMANGPGMWSGGSGSFANPSNAMTTYTPAAAQEGTTFNLTYTVTNSCGATNDAVSVTYPANQAQFQYNPNILCTNGSPQAPTHNTFGRNGTYTYTPIGGNGTLSINSVSGVITPSTSTPGVYKITNTIPASTAGPSLIITGILDGPLTGGLPKFIELYAIQAIPDLSIFGLENASNGTPSAGVPDYVFPAVSVAAGAFIYVASETTGFTQWMGFAPNFVNAVANNNGDDAVLLFQSGSIVDVYGVPGVDGTGQSWETLDGWGHRNPGSCPSAVYIPSQWSYSGIDALDDSNVTTGTNATATPPYPTANFSPGLCGGSSSCTFVFMDTITIRPAPVVDAGPGRVTCGPMAVTLAASGVGTWNGGAGTFSNVNSPSSTYTPNASEVGSSVYLYYTATDAICGVSKDSTSITFIQPPLSAQFTYQAQEFCPNGANPVVSHTTGVDGIYRVTQGNPNNVDLDNLTGEIELSNTQIGTYTVTNNVYACGNLIITGFVDGPLVGGQPKAIEFYAIEDIADLSIYGLGVANNGGGSDGIEDVFPNDFVPKGSFIYAAVNGVDFQAYFGFAPDYIFPDFQINGDDAIELFCSGDVIDVFGEINQSGTGLPWEYMDGWVYRKNNQNIAGNYFNVNDWIYGGVNVLDNTTTNATAPTPFPLGTFTTNATPVCPPNTFSQTILIGDNKLPQVVCPPNQTIILSPGECGVFAQFPKPEVIDNCAGDPVINQTGGPLPGVFVHKDDSPVTITFEVFDFFGNGPVTCSYQVNILEYPYPTTALACNDRINLSLDADCYAFVNADMILEGGPYGCYDDYIVNISGIMGQEITQPGVYNVTVTDPDTGNSCWGVIYAEDKLPPIIRCEQPMCDLLDLQGIWDSEDNDFAPGACWAFDGFAPNPGILYDVLEFTVAVGGNYTFTMDDSPLFDGIAGIYAGSFDANDPCTNLIGGDDDINGIFETEPSFTINLTPGTYYLVSSTWVAGQMGSYSWTFSGPANLQTPCHFTCLDKEGILNGDIEIPEPEVFECSDYTLTHTTKVTGDECIGENIVIEYIVTDLLGSKASCSQRIAIQPLSIDDVLYPVSPAILTCNSGTTPQEISNYFEDVSYGYPYVINFLGDALPIDNATCNIYATYHDAVIAACGTACLGNSKIVRTWTLLDWCTLETANYVQIIKAVDTKAPTFIVKDVTVSVNPWGCVANFQAPMPWELQDNCDAHPVWWLEGPAGVVITGNPTDGYFVTGAPKGRHAFTYKAVDCCGNIGSAVAYVTVIDRSAPVAVAKQNIVISLTGSGTAGDGAAKLYAWMVDNGSYDHCTAVKLEIRRPDGSPDCGNLGVDDHNNNITFDDDDSASPQVRWAHPNDSRDDTDNGAFVKFCCEDLGSEISVVHQVTMRVWDDGNMNGVIGDNLIIDGMQDNYNETWADIRVENKIPPVLVCPLDATITCDMELNLSTSWKSVEGVNLTMTGGPAVAYDLCNGIGVEYKDTPSWTNTCENVGRIRREFRAVKGDKTVNCYQTITVNALPSTFVVTPPSSSVLDAPCDFNEDDIKASDKPKVQGGPCDVIGENIHIDTFLFEDGVCKKWRVTYNYINWCTGEQKGPYVKYYKFKDDEKPVLTCQDQMFAANPNPQNPNGNCEGTVNLEATATDGGGCSANGWLKWQVFVDLWGNGTVDLEYSSFLPTTDNNINNDTNQNGINDRYVAPTASGGVLKVPAFVLDAENSVHKVQWKVTDGCGNVTDCYSTFMVVDKKAPTPYCLSLSSAVMQNGQVELWAIDFDKGSFDNCTPKNALMFTFNGEFPVWSRITEEHYFKGAGLSATVAEYNAGNAQKWVPAYRSSAMIFNCDDVEASPITLNMSVWDARQNTDFCSVELTLIDNQGGCGGSRMMVAGDIKTEKGLGVKNADVILRSNQAGMEKQRLTDISGDYVFGDLPVMVDYHVTGKKRDDWMNGVSTLDLVMMQRHILGVAPFHNAYKMVAADVNNDSKVSASDMVVLRKLILGLITELPNNDSWRFLDAQTPITNPDNPWPLDEEIVINAVDHDMMGQHLMGVKVGDVTQDASASGIIAESRSDETLKLTLENQFINKDEIVSIDIKSSDFIDVNGIQFTLNTGDLNVLALEGGKLNVDTNNYGMLSDNVITFSWSSDKAASFATDEVLFTITVKAQKAAWLLDQLVLGSSVTAAEAYVGENKQLVKPVLKAINSTTVNDLFAVRQNEPNPFKQSTSIGYYLPEKGEVKLTITSIDGKVILTRQWQAPQGNNTIEMNSGDISVPGIYYYSVGYKGETLTKALVKVE